MGDKFSIGKKHSIRGLDVDFKDGNLFVGDAEGKKVFHYTFKTPFKIKNTFELKGTYTTPGEPRVCKFWPERDELYVGCAKGRITVFELQNSAGGPICKKKVLRVFRHFQRTYNGYCVT